ncbi:MAG TPA: phosphatidate cytidylyltransferase [Bacteroidota bacterium]|nr:phosphatidate cytidylyltransferase [Bacteroidota bacterium]
MAFSNLTTRVLVALAGIPIVIAATMVGGYLFFAVVLLVSLVGLHEFYGLARAKGASPQAPLGYLLGILVVTVFLYDRLRLLIVAAFDRGGIAIPFPTMAQELLILLLAFIPAILILELFRGKPNPLTNIAVTIMGAMYVSFFFGTLVGLRELFVPGDFPVYLHFPLTGVGVPEEIASTIYLWGGWTVLTVFISVWMCDSAAYFAGRAFGRHKLFERVSPNKTWEGAVAGFIGAILAFLLMKSLVLPYLSWSQALVCGTIVGVVGQLGDLAESLLKRDAGVKDSSTLIPGHGGVLDRFDSILAVSPVLFLYLDFIVF